MGFDYAGKVRALLESAEGQERSAERYEAQGDHERAAEFRRGAENFRAKALEWMDRYRIDEEAALATDPTSAVPTSVIIRMTLRSGWEMAHHYGTMIRVIADHTGCRVNPGTAYGREFPEMVATLVGYEGDIKYAEFLWTSAHLMFSTRIDPHWDSSLAETENVFRMRSAGIERRIIADAAWGAGAGNLPSNRSKIQRIYLREAGARGEQARAAGLGFNTDHYRAAYAETFVQTLSMRLRQARDAADSVGGAIVLSGRKERVDEAFYDIFPNLRPSTEPAKPYVAPNADCPRCKAAKSGYCREHGYLKPSTWTEADEARWQRRINGLSARAGRSSGRDAAEGVVIRQTTERTGRIESSGHALEM